MESQRKAEEKFEPTLWLVACIVGVLIGASLLWATAVQQRVDPAVVPTATGWRLEGQPGKLFQSIEIDGERQPIDPVWLLESPGHARDSAQLNRLYQGEALLMRAVSAESVRVVTADGVAVKLAFSRRGLADIGPRFWLPFLTGLAVYAFALLAVRVGGAQWSTLFMWLAAAGYFAAIASHGWHSDRPWAVPDAMWGLVNWMTVSAASLSVWGIVALLWVAPERVGRPVVAAALCMMVPLADRLATNLHGTAAPHRWVLGVGLVAMVVLFCVQWRRSSQQLVGRVALRWALFALAPGIAISVFIWLGFVSQAMLPRWNNLALIGYGLLLIGMSALVVRHRLYLIEDWYRPLWAMCLALMVALLLLGFGFAWWRAVSVLLVLFAMAAALVAVLLVARLNGRWSFSAPELDIQALLPELLRISQADPISRGRLWLEFLCHVFVCKGELQTDAIARTPAAPTEVLAFGAQMRILEARDTLPSVQLHDARAGRALFTPRDAAMAATLRTMVQQGIAANDGFRKGAETERKRIAADLHDDIGGRLLSLSQRLQAPEEATYVREALADLRTMTHALGGDSQNWGERLADLRWDLNQRANTGGAALVWQVNVPSDILGARAKTEASVSLGAIFSELMRNAIVHAHPADIELSINVAEPDWQCSFRHPSPNDALPWREGFGVSSIRRRVLELGGHCAWSEPSSGAYVVFSATLPLTSMVST